MNKVGFLYNPKVAAAEPLATELIKAARLEKSSWVCSSWDEAQARQQTKGSSLLVSVGGDGTILRAARIASLFGVPILGVNMGKLGFLTEISPDEALKRLPAFVAGEGWIEERTMLRVELARAGKEPAIEMAVLNDAVMARGPACRVIQVIVRLDGQKLGVYKADGVIVATATGSTGYSLAAGGPILEPQSKELVLKAIAPHLTLSAAIVLPATTGVELELQGDQQGVLSLDGQIDTPLAAGDVVRIKAGQHTARFLRTRPAGYFYANLMQRLSGANGPK